MARRAPNLSPAVLAQRVEPHDSLDDFPTQPWAARALLEEIVIPNMVRFFPGQFPARQTAWEPACNRGYLVRPLREYFASVHASDVCDYSAEWAGQERVADFLFPFSEPPHIAAHGVDWIITNPPFRLAEQFTQRALNIARTGVAMLVRTGFLEGVGRYENLFSKHPPTIVAQFSERLNLVAGCVDPKASRPTAYCWLVWMNLVAPQPFHWIAPCRARLEKPSDYDAIPPP